MGRRDAERHRRLEDVELGIVEIDQRRDQGRIRGLCLEPGKEGGVWRRCALDDAQRGIEKPAEGPDPAET